MTGRGGRHWRRDLIDLMFWSAMIGLGIGLLIFIALGLVGR
jgi:hypothetical protein